MAAYNLTHLKQLEAESVHIFREVVAEFENPVMLWSAGKDSSVMIRLAQKAFAPGRIPFPFLHIDTTYKFREMIEFRDRIAADVGARLIVHTNREAIAAGADPNRWDCQRCCAVLKTQGLLDALREGGFDAAFGGARRDEERSRAKERILSYRDAHGQWEPRNQRPELWNLYNTRHGKGESFRVFPLSNWTELDVWQYIHEERIPIVPLYLSAEREIVHRDGMLLLKGGPVVPRSGEKVEKLVCRFRTLGCQQCTGAIRSTATSVADIIEEAMVARKSEREFRAIDHDVDGSMEQKKREGYF